MSPVGVVFGVPSCASGSMKAPSELPLVTGNNWPPIALIWSRALTGARFRYCASPARKAAFWAAGSDTWRMVISVRIALRHW